MVVEVRRQIAIDGVDVALVEPLLAYTAGLAPCSLPLSAGSELRPVRSCRRSVVPQLRQPDRRANAAERRAEACDRPLRRPHRLDGARGFSGCERTRALLNRFYDAMSTEIVEDTGRNGREIRRRRRDGRPRCARGARGSCGARDSCSALDAEASRGALRRRGGASATTISFVSAKPPQQ